MLNKLFCHPLPRISICLFERFIVGNMNPFVAPMPIAAVGRLPRFLPDDFSRRAFQQAALNKLASYDN